MALCPVCKTDCGEKTVCPACGFDEVGKTFINHEEAILWMETTVSNYKKLYNKQSISMLKIKDDYLVKFDRRFTRTHAVNIPPQIKVIGPGAFKRCSWISDVTLPDSVVIIKSGAFSRCTSLKSVILPSNISNIGQSVFAYCSSLSLIEIDKSNPYYYCENNNLIEKKTLTLLRAGCDCHEISEGIKNIGAGAYSGTNFNGTVFIPDGIKSIYSYAFAGCASLKAVVVPRSTQRIRGFAFRQTNCNIFLYSFNIPKGWSKFWNYQHMGSVFTKGNWHINENGEPVPNEVLQ